MNRHLQTLTDQAKARLASDLTAYVTGAPGDLLSHERGSPETARARQIAMYLCHVAFGMSMARVALAFGRDRSTVGHGCHVIEDGRDDPAFDQWLDAMESTLRTAPPPRLRAA